MGKEGICCVHAPPQGQQSHCGSQLLILSCGAKLYSYHLHLPLCHFALFGSSETHLPCLSFPSTGPHTLLFILGTLLHFFTIFFYTLCFLPECPESAFLKLRGKPVASCSQASNPPCALPKQATRPLQCGFVLPVLVLCSWPCYCLVYPAVHTLPDLRPPPALTRLLACPLPLQEPRGSYCDQRSAGLKLSSVLLLSPK